METVDPQEVSIGKPQPSTSAPKTSRTSSPTPIVTLDKAIIMYPKIDTPLHNMGIYSGLKLRWEDGVTGSQSVYYCQAEGCDRHKYICYDHLNITLACCYSLTKKWWSGLLWQQHMNTNHLDYPHFQPHPVAETITLFWCCKAQVLKNKGKWMM